MDPSWRERWEEINAAEESVAYQIELLKALVRDSPESAAPWRRLGRALSELSRFDEAMEALQRAQALAEAEGLHRRAIQCRKGCVDEAWHNFGLVLRALERYDEAIQCFERAMSNDPQYKAARMAKRDVAKVLRPRAATGAAT